MRAKINAIYCILEGQMFMAERNEKRYTLSVVQSEAQQHWFMGHRGPSPVTRKVDPLFLVPPVQIYRNIWTPG